jgi:deoxyribodipyrimidine photo-lyase
MQKNHTKIHKLSIFIFRRDHRLEDNTGLFHALRLSEQVVPCFIFDKAQIDRSRNSYFSDNCVQFMVESLKDLNKKLNLLGSRLFFFNGDMESTIKDIIDNVKPQALFVNEDVTPYSIKRDKLINTLCEQNKVKFYSFEDIMLLPKDKVLLQNGSFYQKFTPYYRSSQRFTIPKPEKNSFKNFFPEKEKIKNEISFDEIDKFYVYNPRLEVHGGRDEALKILQSMKKFKNYEVDRNLPSLPTTKLSAYNKFGCVSIREVYHAAKDEFGIECTLITQLFWRDFYYNVMYYYPHVLGNLQYLKVTL